MTLPKLRCNYVSNNHWVIIKALLEGSTETILMSAFTSNFLPRRCSSASVLSEANRATSAFLPIDNFTNGRKSRYRIVRSQAGINSPKRLLTGLLGLLTKCYCSKLPSAARAASYDGLCAIACRKASTASLFRPWAAKTRPCQ